MIDPEVHALTGAYVCDALEPAERAAFKRHLAQCPTCAQEVAELRVTTAMLATAAAQEPPPRLKAAVDAAIARTRQLAPPAPAGHAARGTTRRRRRFLNSLSWGVATAMACLVAILGIRVTDLQHQIDSATRQTTTISTLLSAADLRSATATLSTGGKALILSSPTHDEALITLAGLPTPPPGHTYQLWLIGPTGTRSAGLPPPNSPSGTQPLVAHHLDGALTLGLTVEPAGGSAQPTTTPVLLMPMPA